ncbi:endonuclease domain-containing protein [Nocardiopsis sp. NPDC058789]|uniref:endonuclease domain-containing protein n=1 Tax=Nocardiopsis sp. NPDC058789 TaxID=3346634 RepID=UPI0036717526
MTRDHRVPPGCSPLFPLPRPAPSTRAARTEARTEARPGQPSLLGGPPPDHDLLLRTLRPVLAQLSPRAVAFGRTAAYVWGVDLYPRGTSVTRRRLHVAVPPGVEGAARSGVIAHRECVPESERTRVSGVRVTTSARTALDAAAQSGTLYAATAALDRFLALRLTSRERLRAAALTHPLRARGHLRRALGLADGRSQSPAESWTRVLLHQVGLPRPLPQCPVSTVEGEFRVDLGWPAYRVAVEYDSAEHHSLPIDRARDRLRYRAMAEAEWIVISIGVYDLCSRPAGFLRQVLAALTDRGWSGSPERTVRVWRSIHRVERRPPTLG